MSEAVMTRYFEERRQAEESARERDEARQRAADLLKTYRGEG